MSSTVIEQPKTASISSCRGTPTWEIAYLYPEQGEWTEADYLALNTNRLIELSDGCLEFLPMPTAIHQAILQFLYRHLESFVLAKALGRVFVPVFPVQLWRDKYREPDVVFLKPGRLKDPRRPPKGADLVMEVVSQDPKDRKRDLEIKREEYAKAGIPEYWIVDPEQRTITVLTLDGESYRVHGEFGAGQTATSVLLDGFAVSVDETFAAGDNLELSNE